MADQRAAHRADEATGRAGDGRPNGHSADAMDRAEQMVDWMGERLRHYATVAGYYLLWFTARVREEAEDIWAEAQVIRREKGPDRSSGSGDRE
jgi:hypothetical protein